ncbi:MAG TPA: AI-2E family transporter YdiK [Geobacteraceae bacterium]|nr:AI-2E family transporter YdiK [Geobacteraceae bacterium]
MTPNTIKPRDITSTTLQVFFIGLLIATGFWIIRPFLTPLTWAVIIVIATWPAMLKVQEFMRGKRWLAVTVMSVSLLLLLVVPLTIAITTIVDKSDQIVAWIRSLSILTGAPPPRWLNNVPLLGPKLVVKWQQVAAAGSQELSTKLVPYSNKIIAWFVSQAGNIGMMILNFLLTVIIAAILYAKGETASKGVLRLAARLAGSQGENSLTLAAKAIRGVALGVVLTALIQSIIGGVGLAVAGIPAAMLLTGIIFLLCIAQVGPALVLIPSVIWMYWSGQTLLGTVLLVFSIVACTIDNIIRPFLIKKGAKLPLVLIFAGVIGGLVAFGIIGLFIGPVVLAVIYTLLQSWVSEKAGAEEGI